MTEVEKLYELAGFTKRDIEHCNYNRHTKCTNDDCEDCAYLEIKFEYPPFTAEKQIELIKWLAIGTDFGISTVVQGKQAKYMFSLGYDGCGNGFKSFDKALADIICELWEDLTERQQNEIRRILE